MKKLLLLVLGVCFLKGISQTTTSADLNFENYANGPIPSGAWAASWSTTNFNSTCQILTGNVYTPGNQYAKIITTPAADTMCNGVEPSPFGGNKVICLNKDVYCQRAKLSQVVNVSSSNFIYKYAYKGVLGGGSNNCSAGTIFFNFYDCNNNPIAALSKTICPKDLNNTTDHEYWKNNTNANVYGMMYPSTWVQHSANLVNYIGSCVRVDIIVAPCTCCGYKGYTYFDAECSNSDILLTNNTMLNANTSYTSCATTATLAGLQGFSSYSWQGPAGSGVSGATLSAISTNVPGNYTLTASSGSINLTQQVNLAVSTLSNVAISGNNVVCAGTPVNLQALGTSVNSYSWSNGSGNALITVTPTASTGYSVTATDVFGCTTSTGIYVNCINLPSPVISASSATACQGQSIGLSVNYVGTTYTWNNGVTGQAITVSSTAGVHVYSVTVTNASGCVGSASQTLTVYDLPQLQLSTSAPGVCPGQSLTVAAQGTNIASYSWSTGDQTPAIAIAPANSVVYSATVTSAQGCLATSQIPVTVYPVPSVQINNITNNDAVCSGQYVYLTVSSNAVSYAWNTGSSGAGLSANPTVSAVYIVTVTSAQGCTASASRPITVNASPTVQIAASSSLVCAGEPVYLTASGPASATYSWNTSYTGTSTTVYPTNNMVYYVIATENGCSASAGTLVRVSECTAIEKNAFHSAGGLAVFPNPTTDAFTIKGYKTETGEVIDGLGRLVQEFSLTPENNFTFRAAGFERGMYFIKNGASVTKVIVK